MEKTDSGMPAAERMPPSLEQLQRLSSCLIDIYHSDRRVDRTRFIETIFDRYAKLIPHDAALWSGTRFNPRSLSDPDVHYMHFYNITYDLAEFWKRRENYQARGKMIEYMISNSGQAKIVNPETPGFESVFPQLFGCQGIRHLMAIYLHDADTKLHSVIFLYRLHDVPYTQEELCLHELAAPHIQAVLRSQALTLLESQSEKSDKMVASAVADQIGAIHHVSSGFLELMQVEWPGWRGPKLPDEIAKVKSDDGERGKFTGERIVILIQAKGDLTLLSVRPKDKFDRLTRRERQVAGLFANGQNYKEVARKLSISPVTVRNTLANIYKKLEISDKSELSGLVAGREIGNEPIPSK